MYVCLCNGITERDIHDLAVGGGCRSTDVYANFGGRQCGACEPQIEQTLKSARLHSTPRHSGLNATTAALAPNVD
ncbi:MAG: hypothetical protein OEQ29_08200 [Alphaproteobacteria bacterium]|nr:hypothetical protein [Alphaproteobacteria bacterium]